MIWFSLAQTGGLIVTLIIAISALRASERTTKGANALTIATNNRQIWSQLISNPELHSVTRQDMNDNETVTVRQRRFVVQVTQHLGASYEIIRLGGVGSSYGLRRDVHDTFGLPVFDGMWDEYKNYQDHELVRFVDDCIAGVDLDMPVPRRPGIAGRGAGRMWRR